MSTKSLTVLPPRDRVHAFPLEPQAATVTPLIKHNVVGVTGQNPEKARTFLVVSLETLSLGALSYYVRTLATLRLPSAETVKIFPVTGRQVKAKAFEMTLSGAWRWE